MLTVTIILIVILVLYFEYRIFKITKSLNKKIDNVFELSIKYTSITTDLFLIYLNELGVLNERQKQLFLKQLEEKISTELKTEEQLKKEYRIFMEEYVFNKYLNMDQSEDKKDSK